MSDVFELPDYAVALSQLRAIPEHAAELYAAYIVDQGACDTLRVLDYGCGPGRFFFSLAAKLPDVRIDYVGIDTSTMMVQRLSAVEFPKNVVARRIATTDIEAVAGEFDLVLMSEVIHLLGRPTDAIASAAALLANEGQIAIRTTQLADLETRDWYKYFPACLALDLQRHKSQELINAALIQASLRVIGPVRIDESTVLTGDEYIRIHGARPYSTLREIEPTQFAAGMEAMRRDLLGKSSVVRGMLMTLTIGARV